MVAPTLHVQPAFDLWNLNFDLVQSSTIQSVLSLNEYKVVPPLNYKFVYKPMIYSYIPHNPNS